MPARIVGLLTSIAASMLLVGCTPPFDAASSPSAQTSFSQCERGGKACNLKPLKMLVIDDADPARDFQLGSWVLIDPRPAPGQHYIAFMDDANEPVCEGYYTSYPLVARGPLAMTCAHAAGQGRGELHFWDRQDGGPFAGETVGTGLIKTASATIYFIHGVTPDEAQHAAFDALWEKYRGPARQRELGARESHARSVASFPAYFAAPSIGEHGNAVREGSAAIE